MTFRAVAELGRGLLLSFIGTVCLPAAEPRRFQR